MEKLINIDIARLPFSISFISSISFVESTKILLEQNNKNTAALKAIKKNKRK
jgi:hypothetical protein